MGYTTEFTGSFHVNPPLSPEQVEYLKAFSGTRRMRRDAAKASALLDVARERVGLPIGVDGGYFVGGGGFCGQDRDDSVVDYNEPPLGQPGLWCKWEPTDDGAHIKWSGTEKFYNYVPWLEYLLAQFLDPWGRTLRDSVEFQGEDGDDRGTIIASENMGAGPLSTVIKLRRDKEVR